MHRIIQRHLHSRSPFILTLHRVQPSNSSFIEPNRLNSVTPAFLSEYISTMKSRGRSFVSLPELLTRISTGQPTRNLISLTFDDGYLDNLTFALPVLENHNCPFTVFVTTDFISSNINPWWYSLESYLLDCHKNADLCESELIPTFNSLRDSILLNPTTAKLITGALANTSNSQSQIFLDWSQLLTLAQHPLVTIGSHGVTHRPFSHLKPSTTTFELTQSKMILEKHLKQSITMFAFPYGGPNDFSINDINLVRQSGYSAALTTIPGLITHHNHFSLPRFYFSELLDVSSIFYALMKYRVKSFFPYLYAS